MRATTIEQPEGHRRKLQLKILSAIKKYEEATGWNVVLIDYKPQLKIVRAVVRRSSPG